jgi:hypothetical protein
MKNIIYLEIILLITKLLGVYREFKSNLVNQIDVIDKLSYTRNDFNHDAFEKEFCVYDEK